MSENPPELPALLLVGEQVCVCVCVRGRIPPTGEDPGFGLNKLQYSLAQEVKGGLQTWAKAIR